MTLPILYPAANSSWLKPFTPKTIMGLVERGVIKFPEQPMEPSTTNSVQAVKRAQRKKHGLRMRNGRKKI